MQKFLRVLFLVYIVTHDVVCSISRKLTVDEMINDDWSRKNDYNADRQRKNMSPVELSLKLMNVTQKEADRLAKLKIIEKPSFNLDFRYKGFTQRIQGLNIKGKNEMHK